MSEIERVLGTTAAATTEKEMIFPLSRSLREIVFPGGGGAGDFVPTLNSVQLFLDALISWKKKRERRWG